MSNDLHVAIGTGKTEVAKKLINEGADINGLNEQGYSPLHLAVVNGNFQIIELLIQKGANIDIRDSDGRTPLDIARRTRPYLITLFEKQATPQTKKKPITKRQIKMVLIFVVLPMFLLFAYMLFVEKPHYITPEEKQEQILREYRVIARGFPSMKLDGEIVRANIQWAGDSMILIVPKTYGFTATRFAQQSASISIDEFHKNAKEYERHYFINVPVKQWNGPTEFTGNCLIALPKSVVPIPFQ